MDSITPHKPPFFMTYWRPYNEGSNLLDSYLDYIKDISLVRYGADTVGKYIKEASTDQINSINNLSKHIGAGVSILHQQMFQINDNINQVGQVFISGINHISDKLNNLSKQITDINYGLYFVNRNLDLLLEQQKLSNLLLHNISELLRVPDSEKERQHSIELGIKFFINAQKDSDLFDDALEELLKAETLMKQDYFVLHRIGCIYLYVQKHLNPQKAIDYFLRSAKYSSVESDPKAIKLANVLTENFDTINTEINKSLDKIQLMTAASYEKASFASYVLGDFQNAVNYQSKAYRFDPTPQNLFLLSKYQVRFGQSVDALKNLSLAIEKQPSLAIATIRDLDLLNDRDIINLLEEINNSINNKIDELIERWKGIDSINKERYIIKLRESKLWPYDIRVKHLSEISALALNVNSENDNLKEKIDKLVSIIKIGHYRELNKKDIIQKILDAKSLPIERMKEVYESIIKKLDDSKVRIGEKYQGGILFYLDESGHGLVCTETDLGKAIWGKEGKVSAEGKGIGTGRQNTKNIVANTRNSYNKIEVTKYETINETINETVKDGWFKTKTVTKVVQKQVPVITEELIEIPLETAARICIELSQGGYSDWYLPSLDELQLVYDNLHNNGLGGFSSSAYWSSTEYSDGSAWALYFDKGKKDWYSKSNGKTFVRAIRSF